MIHTKLFAAICMSLALSSPALAETAAEAPAVLTVEGQGETGVTELDLAALKAMPVTEIETSTVWTDGVNIFTGVALADLLEGQDTDGKTIHAMARDGYEVEIPASDAVEGGPIVAYQMNGTDLSADEMGPFWIIYPYDSDPAFQGEEIEARSIWQLAKLSLSE